MMETADLLIENGILMTMDPNNRIIEKGSIAATGDTITAVGPATELASVCAKETIDAQGGIVMPGLVNTHTHLPMTLFRGLADDMPLMTWLNDHIFPAEGRFVNPETVRWGTLLACAEMLLSGTTCCCDGYFHESAVAQAVAETGMRAVLAQGVIDFPAPGVPDPAENIAHARNYATRWKEKYDLIAPSIFCHSPYTCGDKTLRQAKAAADELGLLFQVHVAETNGEHEQSIREKGMSPVAHLDRLGILDRNTIMAHCVWVDEEDLEIMARRGCGVAHCPESNMKLASGIAPVAVMKKHGIAVGLGTDGAASNNDLDLFGEMAMAARLHKVAAGDPTTLDAATVLKMATTDGARAMGLGDRIGSLTVGKQADLIILDTRACHMTPMYHPQSHVIYAASGRDVRHVMIAGKQVVADRRLLTLDVDEIMDRVNAIAEEIG